MDDRVTDKLYYKIGEVANMTSLRPSVLRFWETEFAVLAPAKSRTGQRLYARKDLELVLEIKRLLYVEKMTIEGARQRLKSRSHREERGVPKSNPCSDEVMTLLGEVKDQLRSIRSFLVTRD